MLDLFLPLMRNLGQLAIVGLAYGMAIARLPPSAWPLTLGIICGLGAVLAIMDPTQLPSGAAVDTRAAMVITAGFFGGPIGAAVSGGIASAYRATLGGPTVHLGIAVIFIGAIVGAVGNHIFVRQDKPIRMVHVVIVALLSPLTWIGVFLLPWAQAMEVANRLFLPANAIRIAGVLMLGLMILHERRRVEAEGTIRRLAYIDELSGLPNRRAFYANLEQAWARWQRQGEPHTIVMIDIDHFKRINDAYGHPTGDEVIRRLAAILSEESRKTDVVARLGGEEFAVLLANAQSHFGAAFAERVRRRVAEEALVTDAATLRFTVSLGVSHDLNRQTSRQDLLSSSDQALYEAKRTGRNKVVVDVPVRPEPA